MSDVEEGPEKLLPCHRYWQDKFPSILWTLRGMAEMKTAPPRRRFKPIPHASLGGDKRLIPAGKEGRELADDLPDPLGKRVG